MLLIGSRAAKYHYPDFRQPVKDWDFLATPAELAIWVEKHSIVRHKIKDDHKLLAVTNDGNKYEFEIVKPGSSSDLFMKNPWNLTLHIEDYYIACPTTLMLIKLSHIRHPIHWRKNIEDYHFLKSKRKSNPIMMENDLLTKAYELRKNEVDARQKQRKINLNISNDEFFAKSNKVKRFYDHDDLHRATCYDQRPIYEGLKYDKNKTLIEKQLFDILSHENKLRTVREECFAIALERKIIPAIEKGQSFDKNESFMYALQKVSTTLTKGWFREFCLEHYPEIKVLDRDYLGHFLDTINEGKISYG